MTTELRNKIEELQKELASLEEHERKVNEDKQRLQYIENAKTMKLEIVEVKDVGSFRLLWDTTEVFEVKIHGDKPIGGWHNETIRSVGYIISRKHKKIIGQNGGGHLILWTPNYPREQNNSYMDESWRIMRERAQQAMDTYLANL